MANGSGELYSSQQFYSTIADDFDTGGLETRIIISMKVLGYINNPILVS